MIDWNSEKTDRLLELREEGHSESKIADQLSKEFGMFTTRDAIHNKLARINESKGGLQKRQIHSIMPWYDKYKSIIEGEGIPKEHSVNHYVLDIPEKFLKILYIGDLHIPFQLDEQIEEACDNNINADVVVTAEVMDCYSLSRFRKNLSVPLEQEIDWTVRYFEYLNEKFDRVIVVGGNHINRISRSFMDSVPTPLLFLVREDMLELLAKPFPHINVVNQVCFQINDTVFAHAELFSRVDLKAGMRAYDFFNEWKDALGLKDFRCVVQGHTHMMGVGYRANMKVMEGGCLCRVPDYAIEKFYSKPQQNGYVVIRQNNGYTDFNKSREFVFQLQKYIPNFNPTKSFNEKDIINKINGFDSM